MQTIGLTISTRWWETWYIMSGIFISIYCLMKYMVITTSCSSGSTEVLSCITKRSYISWYSQSGRLVVWWLRVAPLWCWRRFHAAETLVRIQTHTCTDCSHDRQANFLLVVLSRAKLLSNLKIRLLAPNFFYKQYYAINCEFF